MGAEMTTIQVIGTVICIAMVTVFTAFVLATVGRRDVSEDEIAGALEGGLTEAVKRLNEEAR